MGVQRGPVAFVSMELVAGLQLVIETHEAISQDFGHDGRTADHVDALIPTHHRPTRDGDRRCEVPIDEYEIRYRWKIANGLDHREPCRLEDIAPVDLLRAHDSEAHLCALENHVEGPFALPACQPFGIVDADAQASVRKDDRCGDDRARPGTPARLVNTGDVGRRPW